MDNVVTITEGHRRRVVRRRDVAGLAIAALLVALAARPVLAQNLAKMPGIGFLGWYSADAAVRFVEPFRAGLRELNRATAGALGLSIPPAILARADEAIE